MAGGFGQYLKDTRGELKHVAWPTRTQTIVYTVLVAAISIGIAAYLGVFDYLFTTGLSRAIQAYPAAPGVSVQQLPVTTSTSTAVSTSTQ